VRVEETNDGTRIIFDGPADKFFELLTGRKETSDQEMDQESDTQTEETPPKKEPERLRGIHTSAVTGEHC